MILDWMYKDSSIYLKRKHDIYLKILKFYEKSSRPYKYDEKFREKISLCKKEFREGRKVCDIARKYNMKYSTLYAIFKQNKYEDIN